MCDSMHSSEVRWRDWSESETAWGEVGKHSDLDWKTLSLVLHNQPHLGEITVPMATQLIAWNCCGCGCHGNTLHYIGVKSPPLRIPILQFYVHLNKSPSHTHTHRGHNWSHESQWWFVKISDCDNFDRYCDMIKKNYKWNNGLIFANSDVPLCLDKNRE